MENTAINPTSGSVRATGMKYGFYLAGFSVFLFLVLVLMGVNAFDNKWNWIGLVVSVVLLIFAHREFKGDNAGFMTYGQGVGIGFWMSLISVVISGIFTLVYSSFIEPESMNLFYEAQRIQMEEKGMADDQIDMAIGFTQKVFWPMYFFFGLFFGVLVAVIVSIFTQKKNPHPAY